MNWRQFMKFIKSMIAGLINNQSNKDKPGFHVGNILKNKTMRNIIITVSGLFAELVGWFHFWFIAEMNPKLNSTTNNQLNRKQSKNEAKANS